MQEQNGKPTQEGASTTERLENFLAAEENPADDAEQAAPLDGGDPASEPVEMAEGEEAAGDDGEQAEGPQITTADLAALLGVEDGVFDAAEDGSVLVKTKIDGQEGTAKLTDLLAAYQLRGHIDNQSREVAEQRKAIQAQAEESTKAIQAKLNDLDSLAAIANNELMREYNGVDWQSLRYNNPAEYAAQLADFQQRQARVGEMMRAVQAERAQVEQNTQRDMANALASEAQKMRQLIPGWNDDATLAKESSEVKEWMSKELDRWGMDQSLLSQVTLGFQADVLRKAMLFDRLQQQKPEVEKKVRVAPKLVKPGQAPTATQRQAEGLRGIKTTIKKSGGKQGVADYLMAAGIV